ncbi:protein FAM161B [Trichonephila clavipes]|nr:protein FAM161B [Trichonephila clavipes]
MSLNLKHSTYSIPIVFPDQTEEIRNIEVTANKALKNIQNLYNEIMTPKIYSDFDYELCSSDNSSGSSVSSNVHDKKQYNVTNVAQKSSVELCDNCQKVISYCTSSHKRPFVNGARNDSQIPGCYRNSYLQERSNSYPQDQQLRRGFHNHKQSSIYFNKPHNQRYMNHQEQSNSNLTQCNRKSSHQQEQSRHNSTETNQSSFYHQYQKNHHKQPYNEQNSHDQEQSNRQTVSSLTDSESNDYGSYVFKSVKNSKRPQFKITVPKPFSLTIENVKRQEAKELKISKIREEVNKQIEKELSIKFSPKPVPKHVHLPLYDEMMKNIEKRKTERKEKCIEILNEKTKPFNLSSNTKSKSMSSLNEAKMSFKAKPIPKNILSENVSQKLKNKEEVRKLLKAHRAEEMLKNSSLPFSPKTIPRSHSLFNFSSCKKSSNINVTKQTIEAITKRLYTIKCQETIENWNSKVLQNDLWNKDIRGASQNSDESSKGNHLPKSALPFNNFPVRMTTAATLRDNRIRADIEMRKRREEMDETIREEFARKRREILKNIWPRLKSIEPSFDPEKEIEEKVKSFRASQKSREKEYERELQEMMKRVSKQFLLMERQSKEKGEKINYTSESDDEITKKESDSDIECDHSEEAESSLSSTSEKTDS